jgi:hypothetical protein
MAHITLNSFKIMQNTGLKRKNTINYLDGVLTSGKTYHKPLGNSSEEITFESILTLDQLDKQVSQNDADNKTQLLAIHKAYLNLETITKKNPVDIVIIDDISNQKSTFKGRVVSLEWDMPVEYMYKYSWIIREDADFEASTEPFNTFNYKVPTVTASKTGTNAPSYIKELYKCSMKHDCSKYKVKCVYHLQKLLQSDGYYTKYKYDGWWCTYTTQEFKKWQKKKAKVKVTGKFDKTTKTYIKKRFKL